MKTLCQGEFSPVYPEPGGVSEQRGSLPACVSAGSLPEAALTTHRSGALFFTITDDDWRRSLREARRAKNSVSEQIRKAERRVLG